MNTARLKNIVILILALFNAFLLLLLFSQQLQQRSAHNRTAEQLLELFAASSLSIDERVLSETYTANECAVEIDASAQKLLADGLLGEAVSMNETNGAAVYEGTNGVCQFRANGAVKAELIGLSVASPITFCEDLFKVCGYAILPADRAEAERVESGGSGSIVGTCCTDSGNVYNAALTFTFSGRRLTDVSGTLLTAVPQSAVCDGISAETALVRFLDYYNAGDLVCTEVRELRSGYLLQGFASAQLRLAPVWYIETDVSSYYVDCLTGEISRA